MQGMWGRVQSAAPTASGNGFANYGLYRAGKNAASYARDYFDVNSHDLATGLPASNGAVLDRRRAGTTSPAGARRGWPA